LQIHWTCGKSSGTWIPSTVDTENLGGTFTSLDLIHRDFIPKGVHPASVFQSYPHTNEWLYTPLKSAHRSLREKGETTRFEEPPLWYLDAFRREELPHSVQQFLEQWHHFPPGLLSRSGYTVLNDSTSAVVKDGWLAQRSDPDCQDWYFFAYGLDYPQALQEFVQLCGRIPMLPRWAFGVWFSLYDQMHDADYRQLVERFDELKLPLGVLVLDVDWHRAGWCGWDWNHDFFPDPKAFLQWGHSIGLHFGANVHIEGVSPQESNFQTLCEARGLDPAEVKAGKVFPVKNPSAEWFFESWQPDAQKLDKLTDADPEEGWLLFNLASQSEADLFMQVLHSPREEDGIDFWWIDGFNAAHSGVNSQLWTNHVYFTHLEAASNRRALILSRTGGIGSHRYPVQFSADTYSHWEVLRFLVDFTTKAGNVGVNYWSHDLGGFFGHVPGVPIIDPELLVRWIQFGCFCPIVRLHSDHGRREPWSYGEWVLQAVRKAFHLRSQLVPYLYHLTRVTYDTGLPLCRPLYLAYPEDEEAYQVPTQFLLGDRILVAPVVEAGGYRPVYLPAGGWWAALNGSILLRTRAFEPMGTSRPGAGVRPCRSDSASSGSFPSESGLHRLQLSSWRSMQGQMGNWTFTKMMVKAQPTALMGVAAAFLLNEVKGTVILLLVNQSGGVTREWHRSGAFRILWTGLVLGSRVEATGVEISEQHWVGEVLAITLVAVPQTASWCIVVMPSGGGVTFG
jgi:hypothetical protein